MPSNSELTRRSFLKGALVLGALVPFGGLLSACGSQTEQPASGSASPQNQSAQTSSSASAAANASGTGSVLIAYYSAQGHTRAVAEAIANRLGADLFEMTPVEPYSNDDLDWTNRNSRVSVEHDNTDQRDVELTQITPDGWDGYDTVLLGYPIWWGGAAWPVDGLVEGNDFTGKTVIPFCTSSSSPIGDSGELLARAAGTGDWQQGRRFGQSAGADEAAEWAARLAL